MCRVLRFVMLLALVLFLISFLAMAISQMRAFANGLTPYPKRCLIFSLLFSVVIAAITAPFGNSAFMNMIGAGAVNLSFVWMFAGLLFNSKYNLREETKCLQLYFQRLSL